MRADIDIDFSIRMLSGGRQGEKGRNARQDGMQERKECKKGRWQMHVQQHAGELTLSVVYRSNSSRGCTDTLFMHQKAFYCRQWCQTLITKLLVFSNPTLAFLPKVCLPFFLQKKLF